LWVGMLLAVLGERVMKMKEVGVLRIRALGLAMEPRGRVYFESNAVKADDSERALFFTLLALLSGSLALAFGVAIIASINDCVSVCGGEDGWSSMGVVEPVPGGLTFAFSNPVSNTK